MGRGARDGRGGFQTNHEGAFLEHVHGLAGAVDGAIVNPGAWTHYQWSIRDALELLGAPFVEVHLSDVEAREPHRRSRWCGTSRRPRSGGRAPRATGTPSTGSGRSCDERGGAPQTARRGRLLAGLEERGLGALIVTDLANVRYLTGYVGSNGVAVLGRDGRRAAHRLALRRAAPASR